MSPTEAITTARLVEANQDAIERFQFATIVMTYPPGACTLRAFQLHPQGIHWAAENRETRDRPIGFLDEFFYRIPIIITEVYNGWTMIPTDGEWNLNFRAMKLADMTDYTIDLGKPLRFYDQRHRPNHFLQFVTDLTNENVAAIDVDDNFQ
jgi:pre-mRNA-processing factor 8